MPALVLAVHQPNQADRVGDARSSDLRDAGDRERPHERRRVAQERARQLLWEHLSEPQRAELDTTGTFVVVARSGRQYRITAATTFNVEDERGNDYCIQFRTDRQCRGVPVEDLMLAQKVLLECDEAEFLRVANKRNAATSPRF
jgi:hypothetical protein